MCTYMCRRKYMFRYTYLHRKYTHELLQTYRTYIHAYVLYKYILICIYEYMLDFIYHTYYLNICHILYEHYKLDTLYMSYELYDIYFIEDICIFRYNI